MAFTAISEKLPKWHFLTHAWKSKKYYTYFSSCSIVPFGRVFHFLCNSSNLFFIVLGSYDSDLNSRSRIRILNGIYYIKAKNEEILTTNLIRIPKEVNRKGRYQKPIRTRIFRTTFFNFESYAFSWTHKLIQNTSIVTYFEEKTMTL